MSDSLQVKAITERSGSCPASGDTLVGNPLVLNGMYDVISLEVGAVDYALDNFIIERQAYRDGEWIPYLSGTDFATASDNVLWATGPYASTGQYGINEVAAAAFGQAVINVRKAYAVRFKASGSGGAATVTINGLAAVGGL